MPCPGREYVFLCPLDPVTLEPETVSPYAALAVGYDAVMRHIDYDHWAGYVQDLLERHHPETSSILELGCGTGSLALALQPQGAYQYTGTDRSPAMIRVARIKAERQNTPVQFAVSDFTDYEVSDPVDAALLLYDGLNYLLEEDAIRTLFDCTHRALQPGGVFILDQSTPANSMQNKAGFEDEGEEEGFRYVRESQYDPDTRLHTTTFEIHVGERSYREEHVQRAYHPETIQTIAREAGFAVEAGYDGFTTEPASSDSERVHHVLRRSA